ncbi:hypothetical protein R1sor_014759 [Riccia sorocarpa]|uniref:Expansin n=1 Tax=Riccia sorocarpa TaxID=122646 RepID=A0ABD3HDH1_9MARC
MKVEMDLELEMSLWPVPFVKPPLAGLKSPTHSLTSLSHASSILCEGNLTLSVDSTESFRLISLRTEPMPSVKMIHQFFIFLVSALWTSSLLDVVEGQTGHATFYGGSDASGTDSGACGFTNALSPEYGTMTAALSSSLFNAGDSCGACYKITCTQTDYGACTSSPIIVTATNLCPPGSNGGWCDNGDHFDLSEPAFSQIADTTAGHIAVNYEKVSCQRTGGIKFELMGHTNFLQVLVHNVGGSGDVSAVQVKGDGGEWIHMSRSWGQLWSTGSVLDGQALSFSVTTGDGKTSVSNDVTSSNWTYGQSYEGSQF